MRKITVLLVLFSLVLSACAVTGDPRVGIVDKPHSGSHGAGESHSEGESSHSEGEAHSESGAASEGESHSESTPDAEGESHSEGTATATEESHSEGTATPEPTVESTPQSRVVPSQGGVDVTAARLEVVPLTFF